jgi:SAM-dependent methyltransferase
MRARLRALRALLALFCAPALTGLALAQEFPQFGDELHRPRLRQPGKDVMWLPTPDAMVTRMLQAAKTARDDVVYDLGAGDGRIPIAAAKEFGAKAVGIEYDANLAALARRSAERAGVANKVTIVQGDIFNEDFSGASVVTLYLLPDLNQQLRPRLLRMKPGTRIVSHLWDMGEWEPDDTLHAGESERSSGSCLRRLPVAGRSPRSGSRWEGVVEITQRFQRIGGTLTIRGRDAAAAGRLRPGCDARLHVRRAPTAACAACARASRATHSPDRRSSRAI